MNAPAAIDRQPARVTPIAAFEARCEARAWLVMVGELDFRDAVDKLQADAERNGLVAAIGHDAVQAVMAAAFRCVPDEMRLALGPPEEAAEPAEVPRSTIDAADYVKRKGDPEELRAWLIQHRKYLAGILAYWNGKTR